MEALYAKLYDKYTTLKKNKFSELDEVCREQEEKFLNCVTASEALIEHLRSENQDVKATLETLRDEITELRSTRDKERLEYQKRLLEEELKNKALSEQVQKLKELISEGVPPHSHKDQSGTKRKAPESPQVTTRSMSKRMRQTEDKMLEIDTVSSPTRSLRKRSRRHTEDMVETDVASRQKSTTETLLVSQPQCCKTTDVGSSKSTGCPFHALGEHLTGMKLSTSDEGERVCIVASHPSSGLSFTLTWVNNSTGEEEDELLYKAESLGTFQRVVPEWMRDVIKFSTSMIPVFFQRVSRVIKPRD